MIEPSKHKTVIALSLAFAIGIWFVSKRQGWDLCGAAILAGSVVVAAAAAKIIRIGGTLRIILDVPATTTTNPNNNNITTTTNGETTPLLRRHHQQEQPMVEARVLPTGEPVAELIIESIPVDDAPVETRPDGAVVLPPIVVVAEEEEEGIQDLVV